MKPPPDASRTRWSALVPLALAAGLGTVAHAQPTPAPQPTAPAPAPTIAAPGPGYHAVALPAPGAKGPSRETTTLIETTHVKLAAITLRGGTVLEEHSAPTPVTIQALRGRGTVHIGTAREIVSPVRMVVVAPGMAHSVVPDGKADLVLLVHHVKAGPGPGRMGRGPGAGRGPGPGRGPGSGPGPRGVR